MTSSQQRAALQRQIWAIANDVRGSVDGWDFKQYVLGTLFYRFISENFASYIEADDDSINYASLNDDVITPDIKDDAIKTKGYFIYPSQLFVNVAKNAKTNESLNTDLAAIFAAIETSANGYPSEGDIKGLFADFDTTSNRLGNTVKEKNNRLADVLRGVAGLEFGNFDAAHIDLFGDAYEFLISNYAANAGKSGGEYFTPQHVSRLIAQLAMHKQTSVNKIYDPAAGSGSLLLQAKKHFDSHIIEDGFFGQEINHTTYNLARMNMFLHNINYDKFNMKLGNTLTEPHFGDDKPFDAIVSNPPYSVKWIGSDDPTLINDERFAPAGVLAPKSKADFAFVLHALSYLSSKGRAAIVCFPGIFYRGGAEQKIRKYLVDNNYVETVISLAPNLFFGTTIAVTILVLSKHKTDTHTQFIDASGLFQKETNTNILTDEHVKAIMDVFDSKANVDHFARSVPYEEVAKDYNLSVSSYVEAKDTSETIDIAELNSNLSNCVEKIDRLRADVDLIVNEIEGGKLGSPNNLTIMEKMLADVDIDWKPLAEVFHLKNGYTPSKSKKEFWENGTIPWFRMDDIRQNGQILEDSLQKVSESAVKGGKLFSENSIVVTTSATIGEHALITVPFLANQRFTCLSLKDNYDAHFNTKFLFYYCFLLADWCTKNTTMSSFASVDMEGFKKFPIPIPCPGKASKSLEIQAEIVRILDIFTELSAELSAERQMRDKQYEHYRNLLLSFPKPGLVGVD